ncbi:hypothetical protein EW145_g1879 [Phellinidium pouzarii]|uniref:Methyltransferase domain-containing protein n=1 Tax=Phellinidium pouzarii TaxID=167371 RepID=A0A4S4LDB0_9AGAM|nr:hypothetical protein EW145_g1879 [Phellinidium pouzarii]
MVGAAVMVPLSVLLSGVFTHFVSGNVGIALNLGCLFANGLGVDFVLSPSASYSVDILHSRSAEIMAAIRLMWILINYGDRMRAWKDSDVDHDTGALMRISMVYCMDRMAAHTFALREIAYYVILAMAQRLQSVIGDLSSLTISRLPVYKDLLKMGKERPGAIFLDFACCFGNDTRKAIADGFPMENVIGSDIEQAFWVLGHKLFKTTPETFPVPFVQCNALDPKHIVPHAPFHAPPNTPRPDLHTLTTLTPLQGHISAIHTSAFFHLFDEATQEPGTMLFGYQVACPVAGISAYPDTLGVYAYYHSPESWRALWDGVVFEKGTVDVSAELREVTKTDIKDMMPDNTKAYLMSWCEEFAGKGCIVYATARKVESMDGFTHANIRRLALDVTSDESVQHSIDTVIAEEGRIDVLINNAGVICIGPLIDIAIEQVKQTFDANVFGVLRTARTIIPHMAARKQGIIVNVGSIVGEVSTPWNGIYCASKAALLSLTEVLQMECTPLGVSVMLLAPGSVKSNLSVNHEKVYSPLPNSLYRAFKDQILRRMHISQGPQSMPTREFARQAVARILARGGPPRYLALGGNTAQFTILRWLPRRLVLWLVWRAFSTK